MAIVNVDEPEPGRLVGLNVPVANGGNPETLRLTVPLYPFNAVSVAVYVVELPTVVVCEDGVAESEKSVMDKVTLAVCVRVPSVAVMVRT